MDAYQIFKDFAAPIATIIAASAAGYFTYQQWRTAREKLRLDLFDRRFEVLKAVEELWKAGRDRKLDGEPVNNFFAARSKAKFLFNKELNEKLDRFYEELVDFQTYTGPEASSKLRAISTNFNITREFSRYLSFSSLQVPKSGD